MSPCKMTIKTVTKKFYEHDSILLRVFILILSKFIDPVGSNFDKYYIYYGQK